MKFLQNLSIKTKLSLIALIPLAALMYYFFLNIKEDFERKTITEEVIEDIQQIEKITIVLHEIQKERALTVVGYIQNDKNHNQALLQQRELTDKVLIDLKRGTKNFQTAYLDAIDKLPSIRLNAEKEASEEEVDNYYTDLKKTLIEELVGVFRNSRKVSLSKEFEEYLFLLYTKDFLAQSRTIIGKAFVQGGFENNDFADFASVKGKHDVNFEKLENIMSSELNEFFETSIRNPIVVQTYQVLDSVYSDPTLNKGNYSFEDWWSASTATINIFKEIEDHSMDLIKNQAAEENELAQSNLTANFILMASVILLIMVVVILTIRNIVGSVYKLKSAADSMAGGDDEVVLDLNSKDEIGELAQSFKRMISVTKEFSNNAESIGNGDYSAQIKIRSANDTLGNALSSMKKNLQRLSKENEVRTWLLTGNAELNNSIRGEKHTNELSEGIINYITSYLKAQIGAIYIYENNVLKLSASYAFTERKQNKNIFRLGEGLVGQAAAERKSIVFTDIPSNYLKIQSGLGQTKPKNIIVYPFLHEGNLKGVIELGSSRLFTDLDLEFLKIVSNNIAIAYHATQSRMQLKDLLEETQRQAEELETQQEELKQSNEELVEKTELLENSEAELKAQQEELQQSNEELEEKANILEEQKEKLETIKMALEQKARELELTGKYKSEFLSNMSHELRTPLNSILILAQLLSENKNKTLTPKEVDFAVNICNSGKDLLNLINEILDLSKVESGKMTLDLENIPLEKIKGHVKAMFEEVAVSRGIDFSIELDKSLMKETIATDKLRLEQILRNLLSNAFKFTERDGRVVFSIKAVKPSTINSTKFKKRDEIIQFSVSDTGIGIPVSKQSLVFEAFQQADGSTKRKYGGTGLGLSISRELANALGGELMVESKEGEGSTFSLYLPVEFDAAHIEDFDQKIEIKEKVTEIVDIDFTDTAFDQLDHQDVIDDRQSITNFDKTVLIIEDDFDFAKIVLELIRQRGYKGIIATQGNTGLSYAFHYKPDAILLDMNLPVLNGEEVLRKLKTDPELRHIPVQIISGFDKKKEGLQLGALDFLQKPVTTDQFFSSFEKIENFIQRKIKHLLIVEDNVSHNKAIKELIGNGDVKSFSAFSGKEAYDLLLQNSFDCIIIDIGLPDMMDFELLEKIKNNPEKRNIPIIVYTGKDLTREESLRLNKLANTVVLKTANSHERLFDETTLFLHRVESKLPKEKQNIIRKLHRTEEVLKDKKVLIVDDDIRNIYSLTNFLEEEGMECITAENGQEAIKYLKEQGDINIILMDIMMPVMDGFEATLKIRKLKNFAKIPIIALTAKAMKGDREKCLEVGMSDYVAKPINIEQLLSLMRVWLYK